MKLTVIIPARDEEKTIGRVIINTKKKLPDAEILVVDNNSQDRTSEIAKENNARVVEESEKGKARAMRLGVKTAKGEILVFIDGDGSYSAGSIPDLIQAILKEDKDIVYGSRFLTESKREMGFSRYIGNRMFSFLASVLYTKASDILTGLFAIRKDKFLELDLKSNSFEIEAEIFAKAVKRGFNIKEVPIEYNQRRGSKLNPIIDGLRILKVLLGNKPR